MAEIRRQRLEGEKLQGLEAEKLGWSEGETRNDMIF
jgi:hypothetical protein